MLVTFPSYFQWKLDKSQIGPWWIIFFNLPFMCHCNLTSTKETGILITGILLLFFLFISTKNYLDLLFLTLFNAIIGRTGLAEPFHGPNELLERRVLEGAITVACLFQKNTHTRSKKRKSEVDLNHSKKMKEENVNDWKPRG